MKAKVLTRGDNGSKSCKVDGVSVGDCSSVNVGDILNNPIVKVVARGGGSGCEINGVSVGDCSTINIGDIANDLKAKVASRGEGESCKINGISVLVS